MLITFKISNFLSFDESIVFSMRAGKVESLPFHSIKGTKRTDIDILKSSIIYGANASGKSNFIKSIDFARKLILRGISNINTDNKHFKLDTENIAKPTQIEFEFKVGNKMYAYGIVLSLHENKIKEEWLFELLKTTDKPIFERKVLDNGKSDISLKIKLEKDGLNRFEVYKKDIKDNQLFLTEVNNKDLSEIKNINAFIDSYEWFKNSITIIYPNMGINGLDFIGNDEEMKKSFTFFLQHFKTQIMAVETIEQDIEDKVPTKLQDEILNDLKSENAKAVSIRLGQNSYTFSKNDKGEVKIFKLQTKHKLRNNEDMIDFEVSEESDGTRRLMDLIPALVGLTKSNGTYIIDEIDRSLHPELTQKILEFFLISTKNIESQLIVTTHESSLLNLELLRRDEIWFVEKDLYGASKMYSLEEFKPRHDKEVRKAYLQGRFGAIPFISNVEELGW